RRDARRGPTASSTERHQNRHRPRCAQTTAGPVRHRRQGMGREGGYSSPFLLCLERGEGGAGKRIPKAERDAQIIHPTVLIYVPLGPQTFVFLVEAPVVIALESLDQLVVLSAKQAHLSHCLPPGYGRGRNSHRC